MADGLLRDSNGEPVMELRDRDSSGRFITPRYFYIFKEADNDAG